MYLGHTVALTQEGDDFYPLLVGINILGKGGFSARLMRIVREEMGLTYGVGASLTSKFDTYGNMFLIGAQFETKNTQKGINAITKVLKDLIKSGATQNELEVIQESMLGNINSYNASSATLSSTLHANLIKNRPSNFLKEYARKIEYVTLEEVNNALQKYIQPDILTITAAGSIDENLKEKL